MRVLTLLALFLATLAKSASAQPDVQWRAYVQGEVGFPIASQEFTDRYAPAGFGGGAGIGAILTPRWTITANVYYTYVGLDTDGFVIAEGLSSDATVSGGAASVVYTAAGARFNLVQGVAGRIKPYALGGVGWYYVFREEFTVTSSVIGEVSGDSDTESALGLNFGVGVDFPITEALNGFVEGQYQVGFTQDTTTTIPVRVGIALALGRRQ